MDTDQLEWIWKRMEIGGPLPGWEAMSEGHLHFLERTDDAARWWRFAPDGPWLPALETAEAAEASTRSKRALKKTRKRQRPAQPPKRAS